MDIETKLKNLLISKRNLDNMTKTQNEDLEEDAFRLYHDIGNELNDLVMEALATIFNNYYDVLVSDTFRPHYDSHAFYGNHVDVDEMIEILINYWK